MAPEEQARPFRDTVREAGELAGAGPDAGRTFFLQEPMPLIQSGKYSLAPDVRQGWKPDASRVRTDPTLALALVAAPARPPHAAQAQSSRGSAPEMPGTTYGIGASPRKLVEDVAEESDDDLARAMASFPKPPVVTVTLGTTRQEDNTSRQEESKADEEQKQPPQKQGEAASKVPAERIRPEASATGDLHTAQEGDVTAMDPGAEQPSEAIP